MGRKITKIIISASVPCILLVTDLTNINQTLFWFLLITLIIFIIDARLFNNGYKSEKRKKKEAENDFVMEKYGVARNIKEGEEE